MLILSRKESFKMTRYTSKSKRTQTKRMEWSYSKTLLPHKLGKAWEDQAFSVVVEGVCLPQICVVLATVPGYPAGVRVWNRTGWSSPGCYLENRGTHRVWGRVRTGLRFHFTVPPTLAPIKYLSSDRIMTWSVRKLCSISRSFISRFQICNPTDIRWVAVK